MNRYRIYFVPVLLVAMVGLYIPIKHYQNNVNGSSRGTQSVPTKKTAASVGKDSLLTGKTIITPVEHIKSRELTGANADIPVPGEFAEYINSPEPTDANAGMAATGEFADQVNIPIGNADCEELCADFANANAPAAGEFADQINSEDILKQALLNNAELYVEIELIDVSADSVPPTELGAFSPSQH